MKYSFPAFENGFIRAAAASPALRVADCAYNADQIIGVMREYAEKNVQLLCLPEFALTGYTCSDLFLQETLLRGAEDGLAAILKASEGLNLVVLVGLPVRHNGKLYNCAAVLCNGELLGLVPKMHLPNYGEFYEKRHFIPGMREPECIELAGQETLIGTNLLFACKQMPAFVLAAEVCEDLWAPVPPSCAHALAGATVVANLSASDETVGKAAYRRELVCGQSARLLCAYLYADAGHGESTTDMTFAGHNLIAENGSLLADTAPFAGEDAVTELDLGRMVQERQRNTTFMPETDGYTTVEFELPPVEFSLTRPVSYALIIPSFFAEHFECLDDYASSAVFAGLIRILKYLAFLLAVFGPGLYVMAVAFAPEIIPIQLLTKLAQGETSTPLPPMMEMLCVTLLLEIVREAGLRAPQSISHTVSLVGALIIGETAVSAGIVSVPVLTMAAAATIATLAVPSLYEQTILFRFAVILLAGCFGVPGLACAALTILAMACGSEPFGYDYLYPLLPPTHASLRDGFVRSIWSRLAQSGEVLSRDET